MRWSCHAYLSILFSSANVYALLQSKFVTSCKHNCDMNAHVSQWMYIAIVFVEGEVVDVCFIV